MVSIIIPTLNEVENISCLIPAIFEALTDVGITGEVVIVDDASTDGTPGIVTELAKKYPMRLVERCGRLGLASAVLEGIAAAKGEFIGIMDADGSHDPKILPVMFKALQDGAELVIGSRYAQGGGIGHWPFMRRVASKVACFMTIFLTKVRDATSGYLLFKRSVIEGVNISPIGFKIGLEIIVKGKYNKFVEIPYMFKDRTHGASKLNIRVVLQYLWQLAKLYYIKLLSSNRNPT